MAKLTDEQEAALGKLALIEMNFRDSVRRTERLRVERNNQVREVVKLGVSQAEVARTTDLNPARVGQIVHTP